MGNFNLNLLSYYFYIIIGEFLDVMFFRLFVLLIIRLIRFISYIVILIDNIFINNIDDIVKFGFFVIDIFDYFFVILLVYLV